MSDLNGKTVAIIATDFFEEAELVSPRDALREAGAQVRIYSTKNEPIQAVEGDTQPTQKVEVDGTLDQLDVDTVDAVVVPGGTVNADRMRVEEDARAIVRAVDAAGKPLAVICHGPWLLVSAGLAQGRRLTSYASLADDLRNAGAEWVDEEVVVDENLITSRDPDDLPAFIEAIEKALTERVSA
ncbi:type 1 glutamine amidotransferase [Nocardioides mangrovicus]|uniref:Type 1 glutamine amidotransferase n=1 Tax=Nocardioides mangrovicus TaxID=2478913 RepID=A0A3L8P2T2_9ACTN|nr:type 1 glutamine amidotransferase domain-containing protein [Nocardioides mangrovicus]RLV49650.1 type 1 glutamine amidotransferase [Nocardioides mangrovicus]